MRRISLALALLGAVAAAGCGGGTSPSSSGSSKGVPGSTFTLSVRSESIDPTFVITGGKLESGTLSGSTFTPDGRIDCGYVDGVATSRCSADYAWGTLGLAIRATANTSLGLNYFGFAGDCVGGSSNANYCQIAGNADKTVWVRFTAQPSVHPNWSPGTVHGPLAMDGVGAGAPGAYQCASCHGPTLAGQGIAPSCTGCHQASLKKTGLNVTFLAVTGTGAAGDPITATFKLTDDNNANIDVTGVNSGAFSLGKNQPMPITLGLVYFGQDAANNYLQYVSSTGGNPATTTVRSATGATTSGTKGAGFVQNGVACTGTGSCTCTTASPCLPVQTTGTQAGRVCTVSEPCTCTSANPCGTALASANAPGNLTYNAGVYTWQFSGTLLSTSYTNAALWIQATRQENLTNAFDAAKFTVVNQDFNFKIGGGMPVERRIVNSDGCKACHNGFPAEANATGTGWGGFHSGARINGAYCAVCHYNGRGSGPQTVGGAVGGGADSKVFVHRLHAAEEMFAPQTAGTLAVGMQFLQDGSKKVCSNKSTAEVCACSVTAPCIFNAFHGMVVTYPQTPANCLRCHGGAAQGDQYKTRPTRAACGSCHEAVNFATGVGHAVQADDTGCTTCHTAAAIDSSHNIALPPDTGSSLHVSGGNSRTNAGWIAPAGKLPAGAIKLTALVRSVDVVATRPSITFKLQGQKATDPAPWDVVFNTSVTDGSAQPELITNFTGSESFTFAWAEPQDGITAPADFNKSASGDMKRCWNGKLAGCTLTGPDAQGYYTATLGATTVPAAAVMLTGGIGYAYSLPASQPPTQTDLAAYPTAASPTTAGALTGGLIVPIKNVWKTATGYAARRPIVEDARCNSCHVQLGVGPNFHVGQRNDGPTCSFCHNPNKSNTSSGWSANASNFVHAIHGAGIRTVDFTWEAACPTSAPWDNTRGVCWDATNLATTAFNNFGDVEYPGSSCEQCHLPGTYNFANAANQAAIPNLLWTYTYGTPSAGPQLSPYVTAGTSYGATIGLPANLVSTPITAACASCHDSAAARAHFTDGGGKYYAVRGSASTLTNTERCLTCHGAGQFMDVAKIHE